MWSEQEGRHASIVAKRTQLRKDSSIEGDTKPFELGVATSVDQLLLSPFHEDFLAVWSDAKTRGATLYARTLRLDDEALPIATIKDEILWLECIELGKGAAVVWVERSMTSGLGDVKAIVLGKDGRPRTGSALLASGVTAWQVAKIGDNRLGLASLRPVGEQDERGQIVWSQFADDLAKATEQNVGTGTGELDVHVESMADAKGEAHVEIGYSSHRGLDRTAMMARVTRAGDGNTPAPVPLVTSGARRFLSFTSSGASLLQDGPRPVPGTARHQPERGQRRVHHAHRPFGLRQVHAAEPDRRSDHADRRHADLRQPRDQGPVTRARGGVPEPFAAAVAHLF